MRAAAAGWARHTTLKEFAVSTQPVTPQSPPKSWELDWDEILRFDELPVSQTPWYSDWDEEE